MLFTRNDGTMRHARVLRLELPCPLPKKAGYAARSTKELRRPLLQEWCGRVQRGRSQKTEQCFSIPCFPSGSNPALKYWQSVMFLLHYETKKTYSLRTLWLPKMSWLSWIKVRDPEEHCGRPHWTPMFSMEETVYELANTQLRRAGYKKDAWKPKYRLFIHIEGCIGELGCEGVLESMHFRK